MKFFELLLVATVFLTVSTARAEFFEVRKGDIVNVNMVDTNTKCTNLYNGTVQKYRVTLQTNKTELVSELCDTLNYGTPRFLEYIYDVKSSPKTEKCTIETVCVKDTCTTKHGLRTVDSVLYVVTDNSKVTNYDIRDTVGSCR